MTLENGSGQLCCGAIISPRYVLTNAFCTKVLESFTVRAGSATLRQNGSVHQVERVVVHEDFRSFVHPGLMANDIALVRVKEAFQFDENRQPIRLFKTSETVRSGVEANLTGWSWIGESGHENFSKQLQVTTVPIVDKNVCDQDYKAIQAGGLIDGQICAEGGDDGSCLYDDGAPLVIDGRLVGFISFRWYCKDPVFPTVFSEIAYFHEWINKHAVL